MGPEKDVDQKPAEPAVGEVRAPQQSPQLDAAPAALPLEPLTNVGARGRSAQRAAEATLNLGRYHARVVPFAFGG